MLYNVRVRKKPEVVTMDEGYGSNYITIEDEDGNEFELEQISTLDYNGADYSLFLPADMDEDDPDYGYIILRIEDDGDGGEVFCSVDEEDELVSVYDLFMEQLFDDGDTDESGAD